MQRQITTPGSNLDRWLDDSSLSDRDIVSKVYLSALSRKPHDDEIAAALQPIQNGATKELRRKTFEDLLWAMFNSKEFLFHH